MTLTRRTFLAATMTLPLLSLPAIAAPGIADITAYLNSFQTATARFSQVASDGSVATGMFYLKRPGRMRFEYDPPEDAMVLAGGGQLAIFDPRSNDGPERYPLNQTPLNFILARNIDLAGSGMLAGFGQNGTLTSVLMQDPDHPEYGSIRLDFVSDPIALQQWVIADGSGEETVLVLHDLQTGMTLRDVMFSITREMALWAER